MTEHLAGLRSLKSVRFKRDAAGSVLILPDAEICPVIRAVGFKVFADSTVRLGGDDTVARAIGAGGISLDGFPPVGRSETVYLQDDIPGGSRIAGSNVAPPVPGNTGQRGVGFELLSECVYGAFVGLSCNGISITVHLSYAAIPHRGSISRTTVFPSRTLAGIQPVASIAGSCRAGIVRYLVVSG